MKIFKKNKEQIDDPPTPPQQEDTVIVHLNQKQFSDLKFYEKYMVEQLMSGGAIIQDNTLATTTNTMVPPVATKRVICLVTKEITKEQYEELKEKIKKSLPGLLLQEVI